MATIDATGAGGVLKAPSGLSPSTYTQTYSTAARTVPNATVAAPTAAVLTATNIASKTAAATLTQSSATNPSDTEFDQLAKDLGTLINSQRTEIVALTADVLALKKVVTALVDDLQAHGLVL